MLRISLIVCKGFHTFTTEGVNLQFYSVVLKVLLLTVRVLTARMLDGNERTSEKQAEALLSLRAFAGCRQNGHKRNTDIREDLVVSSMNIMTKNYRSKCIENLKKCLRNRTYILFHQGRRKHRQLRPRYWWPPACTRWRQQMRVRANRMCFHRRISRIAERTGNYSHFMEQLHLKLLGAAVDSQFRTRRALVSEMWRVHCWSSACVFRCEFWQCEFLHL
jgi:hypothetical protein